MPIVDSDWPVDSDCPDLARLAFLFGSRNNKSEGRSDWKNSCGGIKSGTFSREKYFVKRSSADWSSRESEIMISRRLLTFYGYFSPVKFRSLLEWYQRAATTPSGSKNLSLWIKMVQHWLYFSILVFNNGQLLAVDWKIEFITNFGITHNVKSISNFWRVVFIFLANYFNIQIISTCWIAYYRAQTP